MRVAYLKAKSVEWAKATMGAGPYVYVPSYAWNNENLLISPYTNNKLTNPIAGTFLKERFDLQFYTDTDVEGGIEILEAAVPKRVVSHNILAPKVEKPMVLPKVPKALKEEPVRGRLPLTFQVRAALKAGSPSICLLVKGGVERQHRYLNDIQNELAFLNAPFKTNRQCGVIRVGLSTIRVGILRDPKETKQQHAGYQYSTVIIDEAVVMNHPDYGEPSAADFMRSRIRVSK